MTILGVADFIPFIIVVLGKTCKRMHFYSTLVPRPISLDAMFSSPNPHDLQAVVARAAVWRDRSTLQAFGDD